jgi:hypothetical protein
MQMMTTAEYRAQAAECHIQAERTDDLVTKAKWVKLANSWQALVDTVDRNAIRGAG